MTQEAPKIIITGGLGFLGQHIVKKLVDTYPDKTILVLAKSIRRLWVFNDKPHNLQIITSISLENKETIKKYFGQGDIVVHNASLISFKKRDKKQIFKSNVESTKNIAEIGSEVKIKKLILISSISAVGLSTTLESDETNYPNLEEIKYDLYAQSKTLAEKEAIKLRDKIDFIILNPSLILGPGSRYITKFMKIFSKLPFAPSINTYHSVVDARDVADAVVLAIQSKVTDERFIVTSENVTVNDMLAVIFKALNKNPKLIKVPDFVIHIAHGIVVTLNALGLYPLTKMPASYLVNKTYSSEKIRKVLGWKPKYHLRESIEDSIKWIDDAH